MDTFVKTSKVALSNYSGLVHVVIGNVTCDLDSAVGSIVYAYFLHCTKLDGALHIAVLNIRRADYDLHSDVQFVLNKSGFSDPAALTFRDDLDLESLCRAGRLRLTLVDFHVLPPQDKILDSCIVEVIDHRPRAQPDRINVPTTIELVGSCCTLVADKLLSAKLDIPPAAVNMLYNAIIFDTVCLSDTAGRKTHKDEAVIAQLQNLQPSLDCKQIFEDLKKIKQDDISKLSSVDLLRRDLKVIGSDNFNIAIPAIVGNMQEFLERAHLKEDLVSFAAELHSVAVIMMFLHTIGDDGDIMRQLAIFSQNQCLRNLIYDKLAEATDPTLCLSPVESVCLSNEVVIACTQGNVKPSRKAVLPIVQNNLDNFKRCL